jgi:probable rRNA maturation factor
MTAAPRRSRSPEAAKRSTIVLRVTEPAWKKNRGAPALVRRAVRLALQAEPRFGKVQRAGARSLTILLTSDTELRSLNAAFRRKNKPTNVLSFPASPAEPHYIGDVALAYGVIRGEAEAQGKHFDAHAAHLAAHGVLHLLGYDHEDATEARIMESLETELLARLGIADPYAPRPYTRRRKAA